MVLEGTTTRAGRYVTQPQGYKAFVPAPLPPSPPLRIGLELAKLLSDADRALGRLDGVATVLPNPDLFVAMYVRHEAVFSSQIEGTQSTLEDILEYEVGAERGRPRDIEEVVNYVAAMNHGLRRLAADFPLSLRLIREVHEKLLHRVRGSERTPGEFRTSQNWVGSSNCLLKDADFVPPAPQDMMAALDNFERFLHLRQGLPVLIQCGLAHAQFETIHPFLDGNGRIGRLLVTLLLCEREVLQKPLLYLSYYLKAHRAQYYDRLTAIRTDGDWEGWLRFFLRGVYEVSQTATETARAILSLRERDRELLQGRGSGAVNSLRLLDFLFESPIISIRAAEGHLQCSYVTARNAVEAMEDAGILREITGQQRNRLYRFDDYLALFDRQAIASNAENQDNGQQLTRT
ncbi:MAG: Fic family protein [Thermoleophilia bacterium]|nr:Fic family protein [Thermoleophilia bacterium]